MRLHLPIYIVVSVIHPRRSSPLEEQTHLSLIQQNVLLRQQIQGIDH